MNRLTDTFIIENLQVLDEGKSSGIMKIRGTFQRADEENNNKRIYSGKLLEREITKLQPLIKERRLLGELDHPKQDTVSLSNVSHLVTDIRIQGKEVIGEAEILNTPMGNVAQALIKGGVKIGISSRGLGTLTEGEDGKRYVNEDFKLITWDLVADPSTRGAFPGLTESTEIQEILDDVLPRVTQNKILTTLLTEAIREERDKVHSPRVKAHLKMIQDREAAKIKFLRGGKSLKDIQKKSVKKSNESIKSYKAVREALSNALLEFDPREAGYKGARPKSSEKKKRIGDTLVKGNKELGASIERSVRAGGGKQLKAARKTERRAQQRGAQERKGSGPKGKLPK